MTQFSPERIGLTFIKTHMLLFFFLKCWSGNVRFCTENSFLPRTETYSPVAKLTWIAKFFENFRKCLQVFAMFSTFSYVFRSSRTCLNMFGCIWMRLDASRCVWMRSDAFGKNQIFFKHFVRKHQIFAICRRFRRLISF